ncbi:MAG TPA: SCO family protein [Polyangia bacterium]|nr:SCO family protein [Polyangia bacterium]
MTTRPPDPSRRAILTAASAAVATAIIDAAPARAHNGAGVVQPPAPPPAARLTLDDGRASNLHDVLAGRVTALQLIFTRCRATCPIQGAIFGRAVQALGDSVADARWLSVSIDPSYDDPGALRAWLARFGVSPRWRAARPDPADLPPLFDFLNARAGGADNHTAQVYFFDRAGNLAMRSLDFPPVATIVRIMHGLSAR